MDSAATEEQLERRLKAIKVEKIRQMNEEMLRYYTPHSAQIDFHKSLARIRGLFGGNQSGKTFSGCVEIANVVGKVHQHRPNIIGKVMGRDCCVDFNHVINVLIPTYQKLLPRGPCKLPGLTFEGKERIWPGLKDGDWEKAYNQADKILTFGDGSFVEFKSYDQGWKRFQGAKRHIIREDEEPDKKIHDENLARQITVDTNIIITMTPIMYSAWLYTDIFEAASSDESIGAFKMASAENPYANPETLKLIEDKITDPAERAARLYGDFTYLAGRVWKGYGDHNLVDPFQIPFHWEKSIVIDPHPEKPTAVNWFAEDHEENLYVYREANISGTIEQICTKIGSMSGGETITTIFIDPAAAEQSNTLDGRGKLIDSFHKYFPGIIKANNNRLLGWDAVAQLVQRLADGTSKFRVFRSCPTTDHQMKNYSWKPPTASGEDRRKAEVVKRKDDHCDCVRYRVMARRPQRGSQFGGFGVRVYGNG